MLTQEYGCDMCPPPPKVELSAEAMVHFHLYFLHTPPETWPSVKQHIFFRQGELFILHLVHGD